MTTVAQDQRVPPPNVPAIPPRWCQVCNWVGHVPKHSTSGAMIFAWLVVIGVFIFVHMVVGVVLAVPLILWSASTGHAFDRCPRCKNRGTVPYLPPAPPQWPPT